MRTSADGRKRLTEREGVRLKAYRDSVGVLTIGIGHTTAAGPPTVTPGLTITREECDAIFARDLVKYENAVNDAVKVPISQGEFDALVSFCYNIGPGGFKGSSVVRRLNNGDRKGAADAFMMWVKPPEIAGRRKSEQAQFIAGSAAPKLPVSPPAKPASTTSVATKSAGAGAVVVTGGAAAAVQQGVPAVTILLWIGGLSIIAIAGGLIAYRYFKGQWPWTGNQSQEPSPLSPPSSEPSLGQLLEAQLAVQSVASPVALLPTSSASRKPRKRSAKPSQKTRTPPRKSSSSKRTGAKKSALKRKSK